MTSKLNLIFIYIFFAIINSPIIYFVVYFSIGLKEQAIEIFIDRPIYIYIEKYCFNYNYILFRYIYFGDN